MSDVSRAGTSIIRPLLPAMAFLIGALILVHFITNDPEQAAAMQRGIAGPTTWPRVMLYGVAFFAAGWLAQGALQVVRQRYEGQPAKPEVRVGRGGVRVWSGIVLILAYGALIPMIGFGFATFLYLILWLLLGGIFQSVKVMLVSMIGTTIFLYVFVKLALMPLDRGVGWIGDATVSLYRLLQIY